MSEPKADLRRNQIPATKEASSAEQDSETASQLRSADIHALSTPKSILQDEKSAIVEDHVTDVVLGWLNHFRIEKYLTKSEELARSAKRLEDFLAQTELSPADLTWGRVVLSRTDDSRFIANSTRYRKGEEEKIGHSTPPSRSFDSGIANVVDIVQWIWPALGVGVKNSLLSGFEYLFDYLNPQPPAPLTNVENQILVMLTQAHSDKDIESTLGLESLRIAVGTMRRKVRNRPVSDFLSSIASRWVAEDELVSVLLDLIGTSGLSLDRLLALEHASQGDLTLLGKPVLHLPGEQKEVITLQEAASRHLADFLAHSWIRLIPHEDRRFRIPTPLFLNRRGESLTPEDFDVLLEQFLSFHNIEISEALKPLLSSSQPNNSAIMAPVGEQIKEFDQIGATLGTTAANAAGSDEAGRPAPSLFTENGVAVYPLSTLGPSVGLSKKRLLQLVQDGRVFGLKVGHEYFGSLKDAQAYVEGPKGKGGRPRKSPPQT